MHIYSKLKSGQNLRIIIWESCFPQINEEELPQIQPRLVLLIAGTVVKTFQVKSKILNILKYTRFTNISNYFTLIIYLASTSITKLYVNLYIPKIRAI